MADWRGGELRQMRIEIWQSKQILILESGGKKRVKHAGGTTLFVWGGGGGVKSGKEERKREIVWGFVILQLPSCVTKSSRWLGEGREINRLAFLLLFLFKILSIFRHNRRKHPSSGSHLSKNHLPLFLAPLFESEIK